MKIIDDLQFKLLCWAVKEKSRRYMLAYPMVAFVELELPQIYKEQGFEAARKATAYKIEFINSRLETYIRHINKELYFENMIGEVFPSCDYLGVGDEIW